MRIKHLIVGQLQTNCYLLVSDNELAIIDPGGDANLVLDEIKKINVKPKYIINTHYHFDHTLANQELQQAVGADIAIHKDEKKYIDFKADKFLQDNDKIKIGKIELKVIHTPGHTKGSICLLGDDIIFTGDTLFKDGYGRTDLEGGSQKEIEKSLNKLKSILKPGMAVYPGHGEVFKID